MPRRRTAVAFQACILLVALPGCSRPDFSSADPDSFVASCVEASNRLAQSLGLRPGSVAELIAMADAAPATEDFGRRFDPGTPPPVVGSGVLSATDAEAPCRRVATSRDTLGSMGAWTAVDAGFSHWLSALTAEDRAARDLKDSISETVAGRKRSTGRVEELLNRFSPQGVSYAVAQRGGRPVPSIVINAVNPLDKPIDGMFLAVDLKRPDGGVLAQGRLTFRPAVPLSPSAQATYTIDLDSVQGFQSPSLVDVRGNVKVGLRLEDVLSEGRRLLGDSVPDPDDARRVVVLGTIRGAIGDARDFVRRIRQREAAAR